MIYQFKKWSQILYWFNSKFVDNKNIVWLIDVDDTLISCNSYNGSSKWFDDQVSKTKHINLLVKNWVNMIPCLNFVLYDNCIPSILNELPGDKIAITSRHCVIQTHTLKHLKANNVTIDNIISCGSFKKSLMIKNYVQPNNSNVYIFIDDKKNHILEVNKKFPNIHCIWLNKNKTFFSVLSLYFMTLLNLHPNEHKKQDYPINYTFGD